MHNYCFGFFVDGEKRKFEIKTSDYSDAVYRFSMFIVDNPPPDSFSAYYRCDGQYRKFKEKSIFEVFCGKAQFKPVLRIFHP